MATIDLQQPVGSPPSSPGYSAVDSNVNRIPFAVREYRAKDERQVLSLLGRALPRWASYEEPLAVWRWKHFQNPFGASRIFVAADGGLVLGTLALMKWRFRRGGELFETIRAVDMATEPALQRTGIGQAISAVTTKFVDNSATDFTVNTPNGNSIELARRGTRRFVGLLRTRARINRPFKAAISRCLLGRRSESNPTNSSAANRSRSVPIADWIASSGDEYLRLLDQDRSRDSARFRTDRTAAYIHWRYVAPPHLRYSAVECRREGRLIGGLITLVERKESVDRLVIEDLLSADQAPATLRALRASLGGAMLHDVTHCHFPDDLARRLLGRWTFRGKGYQLLVRMIGDSAGNAPFDPVNWHLTLGDLREV